MGLGRTIDGDVVIRIREPGGNIHLFATESLVSAKVLLRCLKGDVGQVTVHEWFDEGPRSKGYREVTVEAVASTKLHREIHAKAVAAGFSDKS